jgi:hypothetical protein
MEEGQVDDERGEPHIPSGSYRLWCSSCAAWAAASMKLLTAGGSDAKGHGSMLVAKEVGVAQLELEARGVAPR